MADKHGAETGKYWFLSASIFLGYFLACTIGTILSYSHQTIREAPDPATLASEWVVWQVSQGGIPILQPHDIQKFRQQRKNSTFNRIIFFAIGAIISLVACVLIRSRQRGGWRRK